MNQRHTEQTVLLDSQTNDSYELVLLVNQKQCSPVHKQMTLWNRFLLMNQKHTVQPVQMTLY